jgi:hypothetical protein
MTLGQLLLKRALPNYNGEELTKKVLQDKLFEIAQKDPEQYIKSIHEIKKIGDLVSTLHHNMTVGPEDVAPLNIEPKGSITLDKIKYVKEKAMEHPGTMADMVRSGARGKDYQLASSVLTPVAAYDVYGNELPIAIKRGVSSGLSPAEYWAKAIEKRYQVAESRTAVVEPGDVSKMLINTMHGQVITMEDCGTLTGIPMDPNSPDIIDRYLALPFAGFDRNTLITREVANRMAKHDGQPIVRSPLTCRAKTGICQKCMGLSTAGKPYDIGFNIGVRAAQTLSEPLTNLVLQSKHGTRSAAAGGAGGLKGIKQLLEIPKSFLHKAELASDHERVKEIEKLEYGGHRIYTDKNEYFVPPGLKLLVKKGQTLKPGDQINEGIPYPPDVLKYKGLIEGRKFLADKLHEVYANSGIGIDKRYTELLARSQLNFVKVNDTTLYPHIIPGDIVTYSGLEEVLYKKSRPVPVSKSLNKHLAVGILDLPAGHKIDENTIKKLQKYNIRNIDVVDSIDIKPVMKPIETTPLLNPDFLAKLAYRYLKRTLIDDITYTGKSDIRNNHVVQYALGRLDV